MQGGGGGGGGGGVVSQMIKSGFRSARFRTLGRGGLTFSCSVVAVARLYPRLCREGSIEQAWVG